MPTIFFNQLSLYHLFYYFLIYSILGWIMETVLVSMRNHSLINRGFLTGCYCPIYGFGMCSIYILCSLFEANPFVIFITGMLFATTLEYFTSWLMETLFKATWWDYSHFKFNLHGRVCLHIAFAWGLLAIIFIEFVQPFIENLVDSIPPLAGTILIYPIIAILLIDSIFSLCSAFNLKNKLPSIVAIHSELISSLERSRLYESSDEFKKLVDLKKLPHNFIAVCEKVKILLPKSDDSTFSQLHHTLTYLREKYTVHLSNYNLGEKRLIKAFPQLAIRKLNKMIEKLKTK